MFGSRNTPKTGSIEALSSKEPCRITAGTVIEGNVTVSETNMRLEGQILGKVTCAGKLILGQNAYIKGDIDCYALQIESGKIEGNVLAKELVELAKDASLIGNIQCKQLSIELGAYFNGQCTMVKETAAS